ncbi:MAG: hypothetical protein GF421_01400 [Candidatus Aminicenantes bacterium]|nr:hypothetical protein [Candidatus Aminicenantes bacterium]
MKVLFLNTHSLMNPGDASIVLAQIQIFQKLFKHPRISLTSRTPDIDKKYYHSLNIKVLPPLLPSPSVCHGFWKKADYILSHMFTIKDKIDLIREIRTSDLVVSSGGGYFYSNRRTIPGPTFLQNFIHTKLTCAFRKPLIFLPQSFGPFYNPIALNLMRNTLNCDNIIKIFAREQISFDILSGLLNSKTNQRKLDICPDMAFEFEPMERKINSVPFLELPRPIMSVTLRQWNFPDAKTGAQRKQKKRDYMENLCLVCKNFHKTNKGSILVFPQVKGPGAFEADQLISLEFWERIKDFIPKNYRSYWNPGIDNGPSQIISLLSQTDILVATRFHSAIFAFKAGTPALVLTYQPKSKGIMEWMDLADFCFSINDFEPENITNRIQMILRNHSAIQKKIKRKTSDMKIMIISKLEKTLTGLNKGIK